MVDMTTSTPSTQNDLTAPEGLNLLGEQNDAASSCCGGSTCGG